MNVKDFDYQLPNGKIAQFPPTIRGDAKLLVLNKVNGDIEHRQYSDLIEYLEDGDLIVINDTKVIKARLLANKETGESVELFLLEKHDDTFSHSREQKVLYRGKLEDGEQLKLNGSFLTVKEIFEGGFATIQSAANIFDLAKKYGSVPIPPYLKRGSTALDEQRYQTTFAKYDGSVAAPTASLNFTNELKIKLKEKGVKVFSLTLHVGIGTFLPIRTDKLEDHHMHSEFFHIPRETLSAIAKAKQNNRRIVALGTTVTRTLEYIASTTPTVFEQRKYTQNISGEADIFMYPGYTFKIVDVLLTNFHAPRSTVLMLTAAFAGWEKLKNAYDEALKEDYKFLSYGDSMLILQK